MSATRVLASVQVDPTYGCWLWTGKLDKDGYGLVWRGKRPSYAHRVVYEQEVGPVPEGKVLDHLCRRRNCVNQAHLEPVSQDENLHRRRWGKRVKQTQCAKGHSMGDCMVTPEGGRLCRTCRADAMSANRWGSNHPGGG